MHMFICFINSSLTLPCDLIKVLFNLVMLNLTTESFFFLLCDQYKKNEMPYGIGSSFSAHPAV